MANWLETLSSSARQAYPAIVGGVRSGLSMQAIGALVRGQGLAISNDALRETIRRERLLQASSNNLKYLPFDRPINTDRLQEALTKTRRAYSFTVKVAAEGQSLNDKGVQRVTVTTDRQLTRRQIETAARKAVEGSGNRYGFTAGDVQIESGMRAGRRGTL